MLLRGGKTPRDISLNVTKYPFVGLTVMPAASKVQIWGYCYCSVFYPPIPLTPPTTSVLLLLFFFWHGAEKSPNTEERIKSHARRIHPPSSLLFISLLSIFLFQVSASGRGEGVVRRKRRRREKEVKQIEMAGAESLDQGRCQQCSP